MKKRYLFIPLIILSFIANSILTNLVFTEIRPLISFLLSVPFYIIIYVYYRETKLLVAFSFISIFTILSYWVFLAFLDIFPLYSPNMRLIGMVSFFGSIINLILTFGIVLQANKNKLIAVSLMFFAIVNFFFGSYYNFFLMDLIRALFGPIPSDIIHALQVMEFVYFFLQVIMVILQVIIIYIFDKNSDYDNQTFAAQK